jgi:outer membrane autotransporter protein
LSKRCANKGHSGYPLRRKAATVTARPIRPAARRPGSAIGRVWAAASGTGGHLDSDHVLGAAALSSHSWGGAAGLEIAVSPDLVVGIAGGGSGSNFSVSQRATTGSVDGGQLGAYAVGRWNGFYGSGAFAWGHYGVSTTRSVAAFGTTGSSSGSFDASVLTGRIEAGYIAETGFGNVTPFAAVEPSSLTLPSFVETASSSSSPLSVLGFSGKTATSVPTSLGLQFDRAAVLDGGWTLAPYFRAAWLHEWTRRAASRPACRWYLAPSLRWREHRRRAMLRG